MFFLTLSFPDHSAKLWDVDSNVATSTFACNKVGKSRKRICFCFGWWLITKSSS